VIRLIGEPAYLIKLNSSVPHFGGDGKTHSSKDFLSFT